MLPPACSPTHPQHVVQLEVDKLQHGRVELQERQHDPVVHVGGQHLRQLMGHQPRHRLSQDLCLVVEALDGDEHLAQRIGAHNVRIELHCQALGHVDRLDGDAIPASGWGGEWVGMYR